MYQKKYVIDKISFQRNESESDPLEAAASASSALGGANAAIGDGSEGSENPDGQSGKKKKNRCFSCKKKVGLTGNISRLLIIHCLEYVNLNGFPHR